MSVTIDTELEWAKYRLHYVININKYRNILFPQRSQFQLLKFNLNLAILKHMGFHSRFVCVCIHFTRNFASLAYTHENLWFFIIYCIRTYKMLENVGIAVRSHINHGRAAKIKQLREEITVHGRAIWSGEHTNIRYSTCESSRQQSESHSSDNVEAIYAATGLVIICMFFITII